MPKATSAKYELAPSEEDATAFRATGSTLCEQVHVLVWLNAVRALRAWKQTLAVVLAPFVVALVLVLLQLLANVVVDKEDVFPAAFPVGTIPRCVPGVGPCATLLYAPSTPRVEALLQKVAEDNHLQMGVDIVPITDTVFPAKATNVSYYANNTLSNAAQCRSDASLLCPPPVFGMTVAELEAWALQCAPCDFVADNATMDAYLQAHPNQTQIAVLFIGEYAHDILKHPTQSYSILRNYSLHTFPFFQDDHALQTKLALDAAALELAAQEAGQAAAEGSGLVTSSGPDHQSRTATRGSPAVALDVWTRTFPIPLPRVHGYRVAAQNGGIWFFVPACVIFFTLVSELVGEKESKRRVGMRTMGLKNAAFWIAWSAHAGTLSVVSSVLLTIAGWICGFEFFTNSHWLVPPVLLTLFCWAFSAMAFLVSVLVRSQRTAQSIAYTLCLVGFVFQVILCSAYGKLIDLLYGNVAEWVVAVRWGLSVYPAFHLAKAFYAIAALSSSEIDVAAGRVIKGPGFQFSDLFKTREIEFFGMDIHDPAPVESFGLLVANMLIFGSLAMYLDSVLEGDQGTPLHPCWCLGCSRTPRKPRPAHSPAGPRSSPGTSKSGLLSEDAAINGSSPDDAVATDPGVVEEQVAAAAGAASAAVRAVGGRTPLSVRLLGLRKVYRAPSACCGLAGALQDTGLLPATCDRGGSAAAWLSFLWGLVCCTRCGTLFTHLRGNASEAADSEAGASRTGGSGDVLAVDGISLTVKPGTCLGLLGHNGAGKSTLLKILSGLELPTEGVAEVNGYNVATDVAKVQATLGCCPQHDLQWPEITAREHLQLFARLKGLHGPTTALAAEVDARLREVNLTADADRAAGTFSGGMRRRLSVGVACIGSPSVILLDEAATGLDPVNRSELWKMILDLKRAGDKALIVTTHDLQEAELLSDRVAIMGHGRVWCVGSSLDLKGRYGGGYRVAVNASAGREEDAIAALARRVPLARLTARDASSLTFAVPLEAVSTIAPGLEWLEREAAAFAAAMRQATIARALEMRGTAIKSAGANAAAAAGLRMLVADEVADLQAALEGLDVGSAAVIEAEAEAFGVRAAGAVASVREWNVSLDNLESVFLQVNKRADTIMGRAAAGAETDNAEIGADHCEDRDLGLEPLAGMLEAASGPAASSSHGGVAASINSDTDGHDLYGGSAAAGVTRKGDAGSLSAATSRRHADGDGDADDEEDAMGRRVVRSFGTRALCIKNLTLISRQRGMCICQTLTPLIVMGLLVLLQAIIKVEVGAEIVKSAPAVVQPFFVSVPANIFSAARSTRSLAASDTPAAVAATAGSSWLRTVLGRTQARNAGAESSNGWSGMAPSDAAGAAANLAALATLEQLRSSRASGHLSAVSGPPSLAAKPSNGSLLNNGTTDCLEFFLWGAEPGAPAQPTGSGTSVVTVTSDQPRADLLRLVGALGKDGTGRGLLGNISQHECELANKTRIKVPYFDAREGGAEAISVEIVGDLNFLDNVDDEFLDTQPPCDNILECPAYLTPDGSIVFHKLVLPDSPDAPMQAASSNGALSFTLAVNDATTTRFRRPNNFTRIGFVQKVPDYVSEHADVSQAGRMALVEMLVGAYAGQAGLHRGTVPASTLGVDVSVKLLGSMPYDVVQNLMAIVEIFGSVLWPIALTLQLPLFAFVSVLEKETGLLELQKAMGLQMWQWHAVNYGINFLLYACVVLFFWVCGWALEFHMFTQVSAWLNLLLYVGWGLSLVSLSVALASCLNDRRVATVAGYVVALMGTLIGTVLADGIYGDLPPYSVGGAMPAGLYAFPPFALTRVIYLMTFNCIAKSECPSFDSAFGDGINGEIGTGIISMYITGAAYLAIGLYFNEVIASSHSVAQHWAFCVPSIVRPPSCNDMASALCTALGRGPSAHGTPVPASKRSGGTAAPRIGSEAKPRLGGSTADSKATAGLRASSSSALASSGDADPSACLGDSSPLRSGETPAELLPLFPYSETPAEAWASAKEEDTEVTDERRRVRAMLQADAVAEAGAAGGHSAVDAAAAASGHVVIMQHLRKVYPGATVAAVQDVSIAIRQGETLAFLGENGCGKSTTVAMVTGGLTPTAGDAWVDGFNVVRDTGEVHLRTGITHQHERLWEDLTCEEHLLFYARLKGVKPSRLATEVSEALKAVGLFGVRQRKAGALSGGMRRRLAVAISFSGKSSLCAEDELTTGSDIATRRRLWRVIQNAKTGRSGASAAMTAARGSEDAGSAPKRVLLVVTHLFDEVEALADRVCIVVKGRIRVVGTPAHLKERFGATYRLSVSWPTGGGAGADDSGRERAAVIVSRLFPDARPDVQYDGSATFMIPRIATRTLSAMFGTMTREEDVRWFTNWGIGQVTLEDVFASVVHAHNTG